MAKEEIKKGKFSKDNFKKALRIFRYALPYKWQLIATTLLLLVSTGATLIIPRYFGNLIDATEIANNDFEINQVFFALLIILGVMAVTGFIRTVLNAYISEHAVANVRTDLYGKIVGMPMYFFETNRVGDINSRLNADVSQLYSTLSSTFSELLRQLLILIIGIIVLLLWFPKLTLIMLAVIPGVMLATFLIGKYIRKLSKKTQGILAEANTVVDETLQAIQDVKSYANELFETIRYGKLITKNVGMSMKIAWYRAAFVSFIIFAIFGSVFLVVWQGAKMVNDDLMDKGALFEFLIFTVLIGTSVAGIGNLITELQKTMGATERIVEILDDEAEIEIDHLDKIPTNKITGDIAFKDVSFSYPTRTDIQVLHSINLTIKQGEKVALVGPSGGGKSTIALLLLKFYELNEGNISISNKPLQNYDITHLRKNIGLVPQEILLFGGTIRENILYGNPNATDEEIKQAANKANALEFIESFPEKYETVVGERGIKLSGGQRQRIAIARALLKNPNFLILDEATSNLDAESEYLVQDALNTLMQNRTTIIIAHRLSTIKNVDKIYVIDNGKIAQQGNHSKLMEDEQGIYRSLIKLQLESV